MIFKRIFHRTEIFKYKTVVFNKENKNKKQKKIYPKEKQNKIKINYELNQIAFLCLIYKFKCH